MNTDFTLTQKRVLAIVTLIALLFGAYFLRNYLVLIVVAAVGAYLFTPLFNWFNRRLGTGLSAACTLLSALASVIVPVGLLVLLAIVQISRMVDSIAGWVKTTDLSGLGDKVLQLVNDLLARVPFAHTTITAETLRKAMVTVGRNVGEWLLHFMQGAAGGIAGAVTSAIIFLYVFVALLVNREKVRTLIGQLNPLGDEVTDLYLKKAGAMVTKGLNSMNRISNPTSHPAKRPCGAGGSRVGTQKRSVASLLRQTQSQPLSKELDDPGATGSSPSHCPRRPGCARRHRARRRRACR